MVVKLPAAQRRGRMPEPCRGEAPGPRRPHIPDEDPFMQRQPGAGGFTTIDLNVTKYSANPTGRVQNHVVNYVRERAEAKKRKAARTASSVARSEARKEKERAANLAASAPELPTLTPAEARMRARQEKNE